MEDCPVCLNKEFKGFIDLGDVPVSGQYLESSSELPRLTNLSFEYCSRCAFIRQKKFQGYDYSKDSRRTSHTQMGYCQEIAEYLKKTTRGLIVDVGCNDGTFLDLLRSRGLENLLGIEPSVNCAELCRINGHRTENIYFERENSKMLKEKYGEASAVIYRHVLEHVKSPFDFLLAAKDLLREDGKLIVELPNSENIIYDLNAHELLDQHISYFTPKNLEYIVNRAGFRTEKISIQSCIGSDVILLFASKDKERNVKDFNFFPEQCENFSYEWKTFSEKIRDKVKVLEPPLIGLGASHPQTRFLIFSGIGGFVDKLIDDDPLKLGKYVCIPNPVQIISTEQFVANPKGSVLHTAFGYDSWANKLKKQGIPILKFKRKLIEEINP